MRALLRHRLAGWRRRLPRIPATRAWLLGSILVTLGFAVVCSIVLLDARRDAERQADQAAANIAIAVSQDVARNIELFNQALQAVIDGLQIPGIWQFHSDIRNMILFDRVANTQYFGFVNALNADGDVIADSTAANPPNRNWASRDYFIEHRRSPDDRLFIGKPIQTGPGLSGSITVSRRMSRPDGGFAGVVVGSMQLAYFRELFSKLGIGPHGTITLLRTDGTILMRLPFDGNDIGRVIRPGSPFHSFMRTAEPRVDAMAWDGIARRFTYRRIGDLPLVVSVGFAIDDMFAAWREKAEKLGLIVAGLCLASLVLTGFLRRELQRRAAAETKYRDLTEDISDVVTRIGEGGICRYASSAARRMLGVAPENLVGRHFADGLHPADRAAFDQWVGRLRDHPGPPRARFRMRRPDGEAIWIEAVAGRSADAQEGENRGFVVLLRDVTTQHQLEHAHAERERDLRRTNAELDELASKLAAAADEADRANDVKSRFLATMGHEVRTPLNCIMGYAELLFEGGNLDSPQRTKLTRLRDAGDHLCAVVERALNHTRLDVQTTHPDDIDLPVLLQHVCAQTEPAARAKGLLLHSEIGREVPHTFLTDGTALRQILLNLLNNAVKFTERGEVALQAGRRGDRLRLCVVDTGRGVPMRQRMRLFREFDRLDAGRLGIEGLGLGLAISARFATALGGAIGHEDNPGGGSIFWVELPLGADAPAAPENAGRQAAHDALRVLAVDDSAPSRELAASFLRAAGHAVTEAADGAEAVDLASTEDFDVVLMDMRMPAMGGAEATRRIRCLPGRRGRVSIIALTAQAVDDRWDEWSAAGVDQYLAKPYHGADLLAAVEMAAPGRHPAPAHPAAGAAAHPPAGAVAAPNAATPNAAAPNAAAQPGNTPTMPPTMPPQTMPPQTMPRRWPRRGRRLGRTRCSAICTHCWTRSRRC